MGNPKELLNRLSVDIRSYRSRGRNRGSMEIKMEQSLRLTAFGSLFFLFFQVGIMAVAQGKPAAAAPADAQSDETKTAALAKAAQNPIADLISLPLQNNTAFGIGPSQRAENELLIEPVIPLHITKDWNLITRTIWPQFLSFSVRAPQIDVGRGADICSSLGPAEQLDQGKFSMGPAVVALTMPRSLGHWRSGEQHIFG
jgi:hypothetical protein